MLCSSPCPPINCQIGTGSLFSPKLGSSSSKSLRSPLQQAGSPRPLLHSSPPLFLERYPVSPTKHFQEAVELSAQRSPIHNPTHSPVPLHPSPIPHFRPDFSAQSAVLLDNPALLVAIIASLSSPRDIYAMANVCVAWRRAVAFMRTVDFSGVAGPRVTDARVVVLLQRTPRVIRLVLDGCTCLTDNALAAAAIICKRVIALSLVGCVGVTDMGAADALRAGHLQELRLARCSITDRVGLGHGFCSEVAA